MFDSDLFVEAATGSDTENNKLWPVAAACFDLAEQSLKAAKAYENASNYSLAAQRYSKGMDYDNAIRVVKRYKSQVPEEVVEKVFDKGSMLYASRKEYTKLLGIHGRVQAVCEWLNDYGFQSELVPLLEATGSWQEAAEHAHERFEYAKAARLYGKVDSDSARHFSLDCYVKMIWQELSLSNLDEPNAAPVSAVLQAIETAQALTARLGPSEDVVVQVRHDSPWQH